MNRWPIAQRVLCSEVEGVRALLLDWFMSWSKGKDLRRMVLEGACRMWTASPCSEGLEELRRLVDDWLKVHGKDVSRGEGDQPAVIHFRRIQALAELANDADHEGVFEEKLKWRVELAADLNADLKQESWEEVDNYASAVDAMDKVRAQIEEEVKQGYIIKIRVEDAVEFLGGDPVVSSLGAVPKDETKVRIVTHSSGVNRYIKVGSRL
eukprot:3755699-Amphidinium_carterae.1